MSGTHIRDPAALAVIELLPQLNRQQLERVAARAHERQLELIDAQLVFTQSKPTHKQATLECFFTQGTAAVVSPPPMLR
jgi:hypothetical protein